MNHNRLNLNHELERIRLTFCRDNYNRRSMMDMPMESYDMPMDSSYGSSSGGSSGYGGGSGQMSMGGQSYSQESSGGGGY